MSKRHPWILIWSLVIGFPLLGAAGDWPQFLGPTGDNISTETGLIDSWPNDKGPPLLWQKRVGTGYAAPSVQSNIVVLHHRLGKEEIIEAMTAAEGKSLWRHAHPCHYIDPYGYNNGPRCAPLLAGNRVYTYGVEGKLKCLEFTTGKLIWERDTAKDFKVPEAFFGVGSTPILEGNRLIVMIGGQPNSGMAAFDAATGKTLWESVGKATWDGTPRIGWPGEPLVSWKGWEKQASYASPVAATIHGKRHLLCFTRQGLVSLDPETGKERFHFWFRSRLNDSVNAMNPVVLGDTILISGAYYRVGAVLLKVHPEGNKVEELWRSTVMEIHWNTPVLHEGNLYAFSGRNEPDATFRCVEMKTGKLLWNRDERWTKFSTKQPATYGRGSAILADGKLIVLGEGGRLGLFKVNPEKPEELSHYQVPPLYYPCWAAPVLSNKRLFLRSESVLICYDFEAK